MAEGILPFIEDNFATLMTGHLGYFEQKKSSPDTILMRDEALPSSTIAPFPFLDLNNTTTHKHGSGWLLPAIKDIEPNTLPFTLGQRWISDTESELGLGPLSRWMRELSLYFSHLLVKTSVRTQ